MGSPAPIHHYHSLHSMAVLSGARLSGEAAKTRASCSHPNLLAVSALMLAFITLRAPDRHATQATITISYL